MAEYTITIKVGNGVLPQTAGRVVAGTRLGLSYPVTKTALRGSGDGGPTGSGDGGPTGSGDGGPTGSGGTGSGRTIVIGPIVIGG
jgi:hypothetical protein